MLIAKPITPGDIVTLKLITNDELIAKVAGITADAITITKPMQIAIGVDERTGRPGIQMSPYFLLCADHDSNITISNAHILVRTLANDNAKNGYIQNTTGLTVAGNKSSGLIT